MLDLIPRFFVFRGDDAEVHVNRWLTENADKLYRRGPSGDLLVTFTLGSDAQGQLIIGVLAQMSEPMSMGDAMRSWGLGKGGWAAGERREG